MRVPSNGQVDKVVVEGGEFELAPIPEGVWRRLALRSSSAARAAKRRAVLDLKAAGEEVNEESVGLASYLDSVYRDEVEVLQRESVAWGVRGHQVEGLPFVAAERDYFGRKYQGASDQTVGDYADTRLDAGGTLLQALYLEVFRKNALSPLEKKDSAPPSGTTDGGGAATTA